MINTTNFYLTAEDPDCVYLPSREEIRTQCEEIRSHWTQHEFIKRSHLKPSRWTAPTVFLNLEQMNLPDE